MVWYKLSYFSVFTAAVSHISAEPSTVCGPDGALGPDIVTGLKQNDLHTTYPSFYEMDLKDVACKGLAVIQHNQWTCLLLFSSADDY